MILYSVVWHISSPWSHISTISISDIYHTWIQGTDALATCLEGLPLREHLFNIDQAYSHHGGHSVTSSALTSRSWALWKLLASESWPGLCLLVQLWPQRFAAPCRIARRLVNDINDLNLCMQCILQSTLQPGKFSCEWQVNWPTWGELPWKFISAALLKISFPYLC